jgi:hypothetical protein
MVDERVDWFAERASSATSGDVAAPDETVEIAVTGRMPEQRGGTTASHRRLEPITSLLEPTLEEEQHTLTITELDMLREDYEAEHTLTQAGSQALRDAVADLKATQQARAANAGTATVELPEQPQAETIDTQKTHKLRSSGR